MSEEALERLREWMPVGVKLAGALVCIFLAWHNIKADLRVLIVEVQSYNKQTELRFRALEARMSAHETNAERHEPDNVKRMRIREELRVIQEQIHNLGKEMERTNEGG